MVFRVKGDAGITPNETYSTNRPGEDPVVERPTAWFVDTTRHRYIPRKTIFARTTRRSRPLPEVTDTLAKRIWGKPRRTTNRTLDYRILAGYVRREPGNNGH